MSSLGLFAEPQKYALVIELEREDGWAEGARVS